MASKYARVLPGLPRLGPESEPYQQRVDAEKQKLAGVEPLSLAERYATLRRTMDAHDAVWKTYALQLEALTQLLIDSQDAGDEIWGRYGVLDNAVRLSSGETLRVQSEPKGIVTDKEEFRQWCIDNGYEQQLQLLYQTMNLIVKERLLDGQNPPAGVEAYRRDTLVFKKAATKNED